MTMQKSFDLVCMGRSSLDLFGDEIGADFADLTGFRAYVGGCPTNICVAAQRMGLRTALITGVGDDYVSGFLLKFLNSEGVDTRAVYRKPGYRTNTVLVALQPPDEMQFVPYHALNADLELTFDDVLNAPLEDTRAFLFTGMCFVDEPSRGSTHLAIEHAHRHGAKVFMDLDYRAPMWGDTRVFGVNTRLALLMVDIAMGGEHEVCAAAGTDDLDVAVHSLLERVAEALILKRGVHGSVVYDKHGQVTVIDPYHVAVVNFLGAGDAFAGGFIDAYLRGWSLPKAAQFGNACGALIVQEHGTANAMPNHAAVMAFIAATGGFQHE